MFDLTDLIASAFVKTTIVEFHDQLHGIASRSTYQEVPSSYRLTSWNLTSKWFSFKTTVSRPIWTSHFQTIICYQNHGMLRVKEDAITYQHQKRCHFMFNRKLSPSFLWQHRIFHIFNIDHLTIRNWELPVTPLSSLSLGELLSFVREVPRTWAPFKSTSWIFRFQYASF